MVVGDLRTLDEDDGRGRRRKTKTEEVEEYSYSLQRETSSSIYSDVYSRGNDVLDFGSVLESTVQV